MIVFGIIDFGFCLWAVFSKHFCDGIVSKHLLTFSAITATLTILDPSNIGAAYSALAFLIAGLMYWLVKNWVIVINRRRSRHAD